MKLFLTIGLVLLPFVSANTVAQSQPQAKTKWIFLYLYTPSGDAPYGPLANGGREWNPEVPRKVPVLIITEPVEVPDNGWDPCMETDLSRQFGQHLLTRHKSTLLKLQFHRTNPIQKASYFPDRPASVRDYEKWKSQQGRSVAGVPFEVVVIKDFKFQSMAKYPCRRDVPPSKELADIIGNVIF